MEMDKLEESAANLLDVLTNTIEKTVETTGELTQPAVELTVEAMFLDSLFYLLITGGLFVISLVLATISFWGTRRIVVHKEEKDFNFLIAVGPGFVSVIFLVTSCIRFGQITKWIGLVNPEARLAIELLEKL